VEKQEGKYRVAAEEMIFSEFLDPEVPDGVRLIVIDSDSMNVNLRTLHDQLYTAPSEYDEIICIIESGIRIGSTSTSNPAFNVGDWPEAVDITIKNAGIISGKGGRGGGIGSLSGQPGGTAVYVRYPVSWDST